MRESLSLAQEDRGTLRAPKTWSGGIAKDLMAALERGTSQHIFTLTTKHKVFQSPTSDSQCSRGEDGGILLWYCLPLLEVVCDCQHKYIHRQAHSWTPPWLSCPALFPRSQLRLLQVTWVHFPTCCLITIPQQCSGISPKWPRSTFAPWQNLWRCSLLGAVHNWHHINSQSSRQMALSSWLGHSWMSKSTCAQLIPTVKYWRCKNLTQPQCRR